MNPFNYETIQLIMIFFVPGFISMKVYDLLVPSERRDISKSLLEAVSFSCINFSLLYWLIDWIYFGGFREQNPFLYYAVTLVILLCAPIVWPILYYRVVSTKFFRRRVVHPFSKPWDYFFGKKEVCWVIIHMKDGRMIGGRFDHESFASSFPAEEQLYIQELWRLSSDGKFETRVQGTKGLIISKEDFESVEFFEQES